MIEKIKKNIFPAAWPAVEPWRKFRWDRGPRGIRTGQINSSQALCIDVFGAIQNHAQKNDVLDAIAGSIGLESGHGQWQITFEWMDGENTHNLNEKRQTQIDVVLKSEKHLIFVECKFTESGFGECSRPIPKREYGGLSECNGNFETQDDPIRYALFRHAGIRLEDAKCALERAGIRYWQFIPETMRIDPLQILKPCPFNGPLYQLMRNLVLCWRIASLHGLRPTVLIVYASAAGLPFPDWIRTAHWNACVDLVRRDKIGLEAISYQEMIDIASGISGPGKAYWKELRAWVDRKIRWSLQRRGR